MMQRLSVLRSSRLAQTLAVVVLILTISVPVVAVDVQPAAAHYSGGYWHEDRIPTSNPDWMANVPSQLRLYEMSIPGTHDTACWNTPLSIEMGKTQTLTLDQQLEAGIRALDIRLKYRWGILDTIPPYDLRLYHWEVDLVQTFENVLDTCTSFLDAHPGETILMRVKNEGNDEWDDWLAKFDEYYENPKYSRYWWKLYDKDGSGWPMDIPTLGEVREKIVILQDGDWQGRRYGLQFPDCGSPCSCDKPDSDIDLQDCFMLTYGPLSLYGKWEDVKGQIVDADRPYGKLHINFLSGTSNCPPYILLPYFYASGHDKPGTGEPRLWAAWTPVGCPLCPALGWPDFYDEDLSVGCNCYYEGINELTLTYLERGTVDRCGVLMMDFPGPDLINKIIALNPVNKPPVITLHGVSEIGTVMVGDTFRFQVLAIDPEDEDADVSADVVFSCGTLVKYQIPYMPHAITVECEAEVSDNPCEVTVTAMDEDKLVASKSFSLNVVYPNFPNPPEVELVGPTTVRQSFSNYSLYSFRVTDRDGESWQVREGYPSCSCGEVRPMTGDLPSIQQFRIMLQRVDPACEVTVQVEDEHGAIGSATLLVDVQEWDFLSKPLPNRPPDVLITGPVTVGQHQSATFSYLVEDPDAGDSWHISDDPSCGCGKFVPNSLKPGACEFECYFESVAEDCEVTIQAEDAKGATGSATFTLDVLPNTPPEISAWSVPSHISEGDTAEFVFVVSNPDGDAWQITSRTCTCANAQEAPIWAIGGWPDPTWVGFPLEFTDDEPSCSLTVVATDEHGMAASAELSFVVANVPPAIALGGVDDVDVDVDEGSTYTLTLGDITEPGEDTVTEWIVQWGDGQNDTCAGGEVTHVYADDRSYLIGVDSVDEDGLHLDAGAKLITVNNVVPTVDAGAPQTVYEGDLVTLDPATFNDKGTRDMHTAEIDWGDGSPAEVGAVTESPFGPPGETTGMEGSVTGSHVYADDGAYTVDVTVTDDDGGVGTDTLTITVNNIAPEEPVVPEPTPPAPGPTPDEGEGGIGWWVWLIVSIGGAAAIGFLAWFVIRRRMYAGG